MWVLRSKLKPSRLWSRCFYTLSHLMSWSSSFQCHKLIELDGKFYEKHWVTVRNSQAGFTLIFSNSEFFSFLCFNCALRDVLWPGETQDGTGEHWVSPGCHSTLWHGHWRQETYTLAVLHPSHVHGGTDVKVMTLLGLLDIPPFLSPLSFSRVRVSSLNSYQFAELVQRTELMVQKERHYTACNCSNISLNPCSFSPQSRYALLSLENRWKTGRVFTPAGTVGSPELNFRDSSLIFIQERSLECPRPLRGWRRPPCYVWSRSRLSRQTCQGGLSGLCMSGELEKSTSSSQAVKELSELSICRGLCVVFPRSCVQMPLHTDRARRTAK